MKKEKGFAIIEIVLVVLFVAVIAGTGYYVSTKHKTTKASETASPEVEQLKPLPTSLDNLMTVDQITSAAQKVADHANVITVSVEQEGNSVVYKVKLSDGRVLMFNAVTGAQIGKESHEDIDKTESSLPAGFQADVTVDQARASALAQHAGKIVKIELENEDGTVVYVVRFSDKARVNVNAMTGAAAVTKSASSSNESSGEKSTSSTKQSDDIKSISGSTSGSAGGSTSNSGSDSSDDSGHGSGSGGDSGSSGRDH